MALTVEQVYSALRECYDPEIPVNIVDLGLVYDVEVNEGSVRVKMSLTTPGCGMGPQIADNARRKVLELPEVTDVDVEIVWEPPWNQAMISAAGRQKLGMV